MIIDHSPARKKASGPRPLYTNPFTTRVELSRANSSPPAVDNLSSSFRNQSSLHQTFHVVLVGEMPYRNSRTTDASQIHESRLFSSTKSFPHQRDSLIPQMGLPHCFPQKLQHTRARGDRDADVWRDASFSWILRQL